LPEVGGAYKPVGIERNVIEANARSILRERIQGTHRAMDDLPGKYHVPGTFYGLGQERIVLPTVFRGRRIEKVETDRADPGAMQNVDGLGNLSPRNRYPPRPGFTSTMTMSFGVAR